MTGAAVTRPGAVKRRWRPPRPPRKRRGQRPDSAALDDSALLDHLKQHALGVADMTATQVRAAEIMLRRAKTADQPESHAVLPTVSAEPLSEEEWVRKYARETV
jgi:hypothetical protein